MFRLRQPLLPPCVLFSSPSLAVVRARSYLLQGNARLIGVRSDSGRMEARAVLRLLLRQDNMAPVLFMDSVYYASNQDSSLEQQVLHCMALHYACFPVGRCTGVLVSILAGGNDTTMR